MPEKLETFNGLVTLKYVARAKGVRPVSVWNWIQRHKVPTTLVGKTIVVRLDDVQSYIMTVRNKK